MNTDFSPEAQRQRDEDRRQKSALTSEAAKADLQFVMGDKRGRRFVSGLLAEAGIFRSSMTDNPALTAFNEGGRNQGLKLISRLIDATPDEYMLMEKERLTDGNA